MQIWSLSHRYSCRYIVYDAGFEEQCQTFNYTSPESPTNHFSVNLYTWSRPNLNKKMVVTSVLIILQTMSNFQLYLTRIAHESFFRQPLYMVTSKIWIEKRWSRHANHVYIASLYDAGFEEQCQTFNYTSPESPTNHFSVNLYTWSRPNLNKKMVVTSCKYGLYRIGIHADILYTTQALKNNVKLSIIPHPNRPRIIFPSTSIHGHVQIWIRKW